MAVRIPPRVLRGIGGVLAVAACLGFVYLIQVRPQLNTRKAVQRKLKKAEAGLEQAQSDFGYHTDPREMLVVLEKDVVSLEAATASLEKLANATVPKAFYPADLKTSDDDLMLRRYQKHLADEAEAIEERVRDAYSDQRVQISRSVKFPAQLDRLSEAVGQKMRLVAAEELCQVLLQANIFGLQGLSFKKPVRRANLWRFSYVVRAELSTENLLRLAYLLKEQEAYYSLDSLQLEPASTARGGRYFSARERDLSVVATISTYRQGEELTKADMSKRVRERQRADQKAKELKEHDPINFIIQQLKDPEGDKEMFGEKRPWWKFWGPGI